MATTLQERIGIALSAFATLARARRAHQPVGARHQDTLDGKVHLTVVLAPQDDATLVRDVRQVVEQVDGCRRCRWRCATVGVCPGRGGAGGGRPAAAGQAAPSGDG
jgi:hypothetical protein